MIVHYKNKETLIYLCGTPPDGVSKTVRVHTWEQYGGRLLDGNQWCEACQLLNSLDSSKTSKLR